MHHRAVSLVLLLGASLTFILTAHAQDSHEITDAELSHPPELYSRAQITAWVQEVRDQVRPNMPVRIMSTAEWSNYINFHHMTPRDADPHGGEAVVEKHEPYDFNWSEAATQKGLPTAELTETGEFYMWWNRCNFFKHDEAKCKTVIRMIISHEARHYDQWRAIALSVLNDAGIMLSDDKQEPRMPSTVADFPTPEVREKFMAIFTNVAHYQCREAEVYSAQLINGEMPSFVWKERIPYMGWYADKCANSRWNAEFAAILRRAGSIKTLWSLRDAKPTAANKEK